VQLCQQRNRVDWFREIAVKASPEDALSIFFHRVSSNCQNRKLEKAREYSSPLLKDESWKKPPTRHP